MYKQILALFLLNSLTFCSSQRATVQHIDLIVNYPVIQIVDNKVHYFNLLDTTGIFYVEDCVVYKLAPNVMLQTNATIQGTEQYFVYKKSSPTGLLFNRLYDNTNIVQCKVDSLLYARASTAPKDNIVDSNWTRFYTDKKDRELTEKYKLKVPSPDANMIDTLVFVYRDDYDRFEYSFSKKMDSAHGMKLTQIVAKQQSKLDQKSNLLFPNRQFFFKLESRPPATTDSSIVALVNRFKKRMI